MTPQDRAYAQRLSAELEDLRERLQELEDEERRIKELLKEPLDDEEAGGLEYELEGITTRQSILLEKMDSLIGHIEFVYGERPKI